jgi:hypothetical protein
MTAKVPIGSLRTPEEIRRALLGLFESLKQTDQTITEVDGTSTAYTDAKSVADRAYADSQDAAQGVIAAAYADAQDDLHSADDRGYTDAHITDVSAAHAASAVSFDGSLLSPVSQIWHPTSIDDVQDSLVTLIAEIDGRIEAGDVDAIIDAINGWSTGDSQLSNPSVFQTGLIVADAIAAGAIVASKLAANSVEAAKIVAGAVDGTHINAASSITIGSAATTWEIVGTGSDATTKIATSNATWANGSGVWMDASGRVRLKDKFEFDGTDLTVNGNINADALTLRTSTNEKTFEFTMENFGGGIAPSTVPSLLMWDDNNYTNAMRMTWFYSKSSGQYLRVGALEPNSGYTAAALVVDVDSAVQEVSLDCDDGYTLITAGLNGAIMKSGTDQFSVSGTGTANLNTNLSVTGTLTASGGIAGLTLANGGIAGSNYNITGVNQMTINDEGEGIAWPNVTMYQEPGDTDRVTLNGNLLLKNASGANITIRDTDSSDASGYISFENNAGTRMGYIGYPNNDDLHLKNENTGGHVYLSTNNTTRMIVNSSGNVGIGTTSPNQKLYVSGNTTVTGRIYNGVGTLAAPSYTFNGDTNTGIFRKANGHLGISCNGTQHYFTNAGLYLASGDWFRTTGQSGWYSQTYGGGIYMTDSTWVKTYGSKGMYPQGGMAILGLNTTTTYSGYQDLLWNTTWTSVHRYSSKRSMKEQIEPLNASVDAGAVIDLLKPVSFIAAPNPDNKEPETPAEKEMREADLVWGFVAEDVCEIDETTGARLGVYEPSEDGGFQPSAWAQRAFFPLLVAELQELRKRVAALEADSGTKMYY